MREEGGEGREDEGRGRGLVLIVCWCAGRLREKGRETAGPHHEQIPGGRTGSASGKNIQL